MNELSLKSCLPLVFCLCAACGGSGNPFTFDGRAPYGPISADEAAGVAAAFDSLSARVAALPPTPEGAVPVAGQATFTGLTRIDVALADAATGMTLVGDTTVQADFGAPFLGAEMTNFAGTDMAGQTLRLDGSLTIADARIGGPDGQSNEVTGTFRGILLGTGVEIGASGAISGTFLDIPTTAISLTGLDTTALYNGAPATINLTGFADD